MLSFQIQVDLFLLPWLSSRQKVLGTFLDCSKENAFSRLSHYFFSSPSICFFLFYFCPFPSMAHLAAWPVSCQLSAIMCVLVTDSWKRFDLLEVYCGGHFSSIQSQTRIGWEGSSNTATELLCLHLSLRLYFVPNLALTLLAPRTFFCCCEFARHTTFLVVSGSALTNHLPDSKETERPFVNFEQLAKERNNRKKNRTDIWELCRGWDLNYGSLWSEATTLPAAPQSIL